MMSEGAKKTLREKVAAGQKRQAQRTALAEKAAASRDKLTKAALEHPFLLIASGLAVGFALSMLIPRSPTRKLSRNAIGMLATVAELGIAYGRQAADAAGEATDGAGRAGREKLGQIGNALSEGASRIKKRVRASTAS